VFQKQIEIFRKWMCSRPHLEERGNAYQSLEAALFMGADSQVASPGLRIEKGPFSEITLCCF
jgi:hypothetical protein